MLFGTLAVRLAPFRRVDAVQADRVLYLAGIQNPDGIAIDHRHDLAGERFSRSENQQQGGKNQVHGRHCIARI